MSRKTSVRIAKRDNSPAKSFSPNRAGKRLGSNASNCS
jgi:hypothetical protein